MKTDSKTDAPREPKWIRIGLTAVWVLAIVVVAQDFRAAMNGRLLVISAMMLFLLSFLAIVQAVLVHGWARRLASVSLLGLFGAVGLVSISLVFFIPPRWFPVLVVWILTISLWDWDLVVAGGLAMDDHRVVRAAGGAAGGFVCAQGALARAR
jgi:hypothetical protein